MTADLAFVQSIQNTRDYFKSEFVADRPELTGGVMSFASLDSKWTPQTTYVAVAPKVFTKCTPMFNVFFLQAVLIMCSQIGTNLSTMLKCHVS